MGAGNTCPLTSVQASFRTATECTEEKPPYGSAALGPAAERGATLGSLQLWPREAIHWRVRGEGRGLAQGPSQVNFGAFQCGGGKPGPTFLENSERSAFCNFYKAAFSWARTPANTPWTVVGWKPFLLTKPMELPVNNKVKAPSLAFHLKSGPETWFFLHRPFNIPPPAILPSRHRIQTCIQESLGFICPEICFHFSLQEDSVQWVPKAASEMGLQVLLRS